MTSMSNLGSFDNVSVATKPSPQHNWAGAPFYTVKGLVKVDNAVSVKRVVLINRKTLSYVRSCLSKPDGTFEFKNLQEQAFTDYYVIIAFDDTKGYNAEVIDYVKQVVQTGG